MNMITYIPKNPAIREYSTFIWELEGNRNSNELILPCGVVELIFNLSEPINAILPNRRIFDQAPDCFVQGIHTRVLKVSYSGKQHLFGLRLRPHAVKSLLGIQSSELNNEAIDLTLINPRFRILWNQLVEARSFEDRVKRLQSYLKPLGDTVCQRSKMLGEWFLRSGLMINNPLDLKLISEEYQTFDSVDSLARKICFSNRHLNRKSKEIFGLTAEELIRYRKYLRAIELMHLEKYSLTEISYFAGFYDQSHFIRVFKSLSDMTPKHYLQTKGVMPFHLFS